MAGTSDSSYFNLFRIAEKLDYGNLEELTMDKHFKPIQSDARWQALCDLVEKNSHSYRNTLVKGESLLNAGKYAEATKCFSEAFRSNGWKCYIPDRTNAARAWSMAGVLDSAFFHLYKVAEQGDAGSFEGPSPYEYYLNALNTDKYFDAMRADKRWPDLMVRAKANLPSMPDLAKTLEAVFEQDQSNRVKTSSVKAQYGADSEEIKLLWKSIHNQDSVNQGIVSGMLEKYGWLGKKEIGYKGSEALFLVVQHAPLTMQEKYLPMMRNAVQTGHADASELALLEDRVRIRNGKKQIYGSQVEKDPATNGPRFCPIEDIDKVDQRRALVGLGPLAEYARHFGIVWDAEAIEKNKKMPPGLPEKK
jgi:hypothetical protein